MKIKSYLAVIAVMACGSVFAQNVTKADVDKLEGQISALSQKVAQLETNLERVITENVNLVEQLNIKTVTSVTDKNGLQWDIVKVEPNADTNDVVLTLRVTNNTGVMQKADVFTGVAIDSNSNMNNNTYNIMIGSSNVDMSKVPVNIPINFTATIQKVPTTSSYFSSVELHYGHGSQKVFIKFTGVHIPW